MEDRVGELLAQRAAIDHGAAAGIAVSIVLHAGLTALAIYAALHHAALETPKTIDIRFAPMPRTSAPPAAVTTSAAPAPKPAAPAPKKTQLEKPAPPVETKPLTPPPKEEKNTVPLSPFGKSPKKGSEHAVPTAPVAPPPAATPGITTGAAVPVGGSGVTGLEGGDFPYTIYIDRMKTLIGTHWFRPQLGAGPATTVYFVVDRDGTIREAKTETSSGNGTFDRAALRAVLESSPLPPLPFGYTGTYLGVHLTFR